MNRREPVSSKSAALAICFAAAVAVIGSVSVRGVEESPATTAPATAASQPATQATVQATTQATTQQATTQAVAPVATQPAATQAAATQPTTMAAEVAATAPATAPTSVPTTSTAAVAPVVPITEPTGFKPQFGVLLTRSIFTRDRIRQPGYVPPEPPASPSTAPAPVAPEASLALKGIVDEDDEYYAFIEDQSNGKTLLLKVGDAVAQGRVKALNLTAMEASMEYEAGGRVQKVEIGQNLQGNVASPTTMPAGGGGYATGTPAASSSPSSGGSAGESEILRRLRLRRMQEGGR